MRTIFEIILKSSKQTDLNLSNELFLSSTLRQLMTDDNDSFNFECKFQLLSDTNH